MGRTLATAQLLCAAGAGLLRPFGFAVSLAARARAHQGINQAPAPGQAKPLAMLLAVTPHLVAAKPSIARSRC